MKHADQLAALARCVLRPAQWDENAQAWSRLLPADHPEDLTAFLAAEVNSGRSKVSHLVKDGARVGFLVFTVTEAHELLVQAAFARDTGGNLLAEFMPRLEQLARECECDTIRFHTMRAGLIVAAQRHGFRVSEVIMRKDTPNGRRRV